MNYRLLLSEITSIIDKNYPLVSNLSNVSSILNKLKNINWCGFYLKNDKGLILGPFQGEPACIFIPYGKGVCGTALKEKQTIIVDDVNCFAGHIACSSLSKSEIVVPIIKNNDVKAVIDIDSPLLNRFNKEDKNFLESVADILKDLFNE